MSIEKTYMAKMATNKSVLKEYHNSSDDRIVYLNNGDEFQIQLFNNKNYVVGARISINGDSAENGYIVLRPGERVWVERPIGQRRKYQFETYEVEDSKEAHAAIKDNGQVIIRFYKEKQESNYITTSRGVGPLIDYLGSNVNVDMTAINSNIDMNWNYSNSTNVLGGINSNSMVHSYCSTATDDSFALPCSASIETGRITTGGYSQQTFQNVCTEFEYFPFNTEIIKILPSSRKPYTSDDLQKVYCTKCGRKLNPKYKYCPYCGTKCSQIA